MREDHEAIVVGGGASGIGAGIRLRQAGLTDLVILEAAETYGGTWRANTYPGCACDVPSGLYSYSFAPNPHWSRRFAAQAEIRDYLDTTARSHGLEALTRFGVRMEEARWVDTDARWQLRTSAGPMSARFLITATGPWNEPLIPAIDGLASFPGEVWHSARWNHSYDLRGKRVAVLGTGASAVQFVPAIQPDVAELHVFQRTAQWVLPKPDHEVSAVERRLFERFPRAMRGLRGAQHVSMETLGLGFRNTAVMRGVQAVAAAHLRAQVSDPELRRRLTPDYRIGCKRILFSNSWYPALVQRNVEVHGACARVEGSRVVSADGTGAEVDAIILGTGFHILDMPVADQVYDGAGRSLAAHWQGSPEAYLGTMVAGFPNAFLLLGPSLGTGHSSAFTILETQLELVAAAIHHVRGSGARAIEVRRDAQASYVADVQAALPGTVYNNGGCQSYYLDRNGRNSFSWPWSTDRLVQRVGRFEPSHFTVRTTEPEVAR